MGAVPTGAPTPLMAAVLPTPAVLIAVDGAPLTAAGATPPAVAIGRVAVASSEPAFGAQALTASAQTSANTFAGFGIRSAGLSEFDVRS